MSEEIIFTPAAMPAKTPFVLLIDLFLRWFCLTPKGLSIPSPEK